MSTSKRLFAVWQGQAPAAADAASRAAFELKNMSTSKRLFAVWQGQAPAAADAASHAAFELKKVAENTSAGGEKKA